MNEIKILTTINMEQVVNNIIQKSYPKYTVQYL